MSATWPKGRSRLLLQRSVDNCALHHFAAGRIVRRMKHDAKPTWIPGPIRPKHEPPSLDEAIAAARCITTSPEQQVEIAAALIGLPKEEVRRQLLALPAQADPPRSGAASRAVVVERRRLVPLRQHGRGAS